MADHFEFAIVGGGKGGKTFATRMAMTGHSTVMIERGMIGGTCINVGCIPTKTMVRSAKVADLSRRAAEFGIKADFQGIEPAGLKGRRDRVVNEMVHRNQIAFDRSGMTLLLGTARFSAPRTLDVAMNDGGKRQITADKVIINTGTRPSLPPLPGLADIRPLTSETIQRLDRLPEHLIVLGGGYIGLEFAQMFRRFGSRVTVLEQGTRFLPREDDDVSDQVLQILRNEGIDVILGAAARQFQGTSGQSVRVVMEVAGSERIVEGTDLLAALGRVPNTDALNVQSAGVELDSRGFVRVNDRLETSAANTWALGDVNGGPQFTHISLDDFRILNANLAGGKRTTGDRLVPYTLFIDPELGRVGLTEAEARRRGHKIRVAKLPVSAVPRAVTLGETHGFLKAIVSADDDQILGVAILAPEGGEIMSALQIAMMGRVTASALRDNVYAHPTMSEALNDLFARLEG